MVFDADPTVRQVLCKTPHLPDLSVLGHDVGKDTRIASAGSDARVMMVAGVGRSGVTVISLFLPRRSLPYLMLDEQGHHVAPAMQEFFEFLWIVVDERADCKATHDAQRQLKDIRG